MVKVKFTPKRKQTRLNFMLRNSSFCNLVKHNQDGSLGFERVEAYIKMLLEDHQRLESENNILRDKLDKLTVLIDAVSETGDDSETQVVPNKDLPSCLVEILNVEVDE